MFKKAVHWKKWGLKELYIEAKIKQRAAEESAQKQVMRAGVRGLRELRNLLSSINNYASSTESN